MRVLGVIVNYRTPELTLRAARALAADLAPLGACRVDVVENDSRDGSAETLAAGLAAEPTAVPVRLVVSPVNGGFGAGNNVALRAALAAPDAPEYLYLLNPDAEPDPGAAAALVAHMDAHPNVAVAGSAVHGGDGELRSTAFRYPNALSELERGVRLGFVTRLLAAHTSRTPLPERSGPVDWVTGASCMLRRSALETIGLFDETFFLYFEETDLCRRATRAGFEVHYVRESRVAHIGGVATGVRDTSRPLPRFWLDSRRHYLRKHHGRLYLALADLFWIGGFATWRVRRALQRRPDTDPPHALRDMLRHALGMRPAH